jgi:hypothetical protein
LAWDVRPRPGLWAHLTLVKCAGVVQDPLQGGPRTIQEGVGAPETRLGHVMDLRTVYDECGARLPQVKDAFVAVVQHLASAFARRAISVMSCGGSAVRAGKDRAWTTGSSSPWGTGR